MAPPAREAAANASRAKVGGRRPDRRFDLQARNENVMNRRTMLRCGALVALAYTTPALALQARGTPIRVHKTPWCGCCGAWVGHLRANGFQPTVVEHQDLTPVARRLGVPDAMRSCHTAEVGRYFVEGHVPAADIRRLLAQRPAALGIAVPGMPVGSPGMEQGGRRQPFQTMLISRGAAPRLFARHG